MSSYLTPPRTLTPPPPHPQPQQTSSSSNSGGGDNGPSHATMTAVYSSSEHPAGPTDATSKLAEAIDDFLGDLEKKFTVVSDEILTKLDDMAERCDRLEQEMLLRDAGAMEDIGKTPTGSTTGST